MRDAATGNVVRDGSSQRGVGAAVPLGFLRRGARDSNRLHRVPVAQLPVQRRLPRLRLPAGVEFHQQAAREVEEVVVTV